MNTNMPLTGYKNEGRPSVQGTRQQVQYPLSVFFVNICLVFVRNTSFFSVLEMKSSAQAGPGLGSSSGPFTLASEAAGTAGDHHT